MSGVTFHVPGIPAPQGSKIRTRYGMREASKRVKPWRELVTQCAAIAADENNLLAPLSPPYQVEVWFYITKPRTTLAKHPVAPTVGDLDKLVRAVNDGLKTGGLIQDDRFIIRLTAEKAWADKDGPGAVIRVTETS